MRISDIDLSLTRAAISDADRIDALARAIEKEPLVLWNGLGKFQGGKLLGLSTGNGRTLRDAMDVLVKSERAGRV